MARSTTDLQVCNLRTWDVNNQCPAYDLYHVKGADGGTAHLAPNEEVGEHASVDHRVLFDVYTSTQRTYLFLEGQPYACADLPAGGVPGGPVTVTWGDVLYHSQVDHNFAFHTDHMQIEHAEALRQSRILERSARASMGRNEVAVRGADCPLAPAAPAAWIALALLGAAASACSAREGVATNATRAFVDAGVDSGANADANTSPDADTNGGPEAGPDRDVPTFTAAERTALEELSPPALPAPGADVSNRWADDANAAAFGQKLFFEAGFSGHAPRRRRRRQPRHARRSRAIRQGRVRRVPRAFGGLSRQSIDGKTNLARGRVGHAPRAVARSTSGKPGSSSGTAAATRSTTSPSVRWSRSVEMNSSRLYAAEQIYARYRADYEALFGPMPPFDDTARFPVLSAALTGCQPSTADAPAPCDGTEHGMPGDHAEFDGMAPADQTAVTQVVVNMGKALGAYERQLACGPGRFDAWMHGQADALSASEQRGAQVFVGRGQCVGCHSGPYLSDQTFHNVGLRPAPVAVVFIDANDPGALDGLASALSDPLNVAGPFSDGDDGRLPASVDPRMNGAFRTPTLRCVSQRPSFMHTGQLPTLAEVVAFFAQGGDPFGYPGTSELAALALDAQDQTDLVAFLGTLDGPGPAAHLRNPSP